MIFSSIDFFYFFAGYFFLHVITPSKYRLYLIIFGSLVFYAAWRVEYVWIPLFLTFISYLGINWILAPSSEIPKKYKLIAVLIALYLPLLFFKYTDFFYQDVLGIVIETQGPILDLVLPLGVSFITFTLTAYIVDIYTGRYDGPVSLPTLLGYVLFFPQLIAGPILRPSELVPQLEKPRPVFSPRFAVGIAIFTIGLTKKLFFADQIAGFVNGVYGQPHAPDAMDALLAIYGFSVQIYCDFSGYTDMAIGIAIVLGVRLPTNFRQPYCATSIVDFWRRWHITLSFWLRDYLYIPLGGSRNGSVRKAINLFITMALGGLWHGASWTFVVWGVGHGTLVAMVHSLRRPWRSLGWPPVPRWIGVLVTFHLVAMLWIFFRAPDFSKAMEVATAPIIGSWASAGDKIVEHTALLTLMALFFLLHRFDDHRLVRKAVRYIRLELVGPFLALLWLASLTVAKGTSDQFIYFDF